MMSGEAKILPFSLQTLRQSRSSTNWLISIRYSGFLKEKPAYLVIYDCVKRFCLRLNLVGELHCPFESQNQIAYPNSKAFLS